MIAVMDIDRMLSALNDGQVDYILIGGMNFVLRHKPVSTFDVDIWINDCDRNRSLCEAALIHLEAAWGPTTEDWGPVARRRPGWLAGQGVFCLVTVAGPLDVFLSLVGPPSWPAARREAETFRTIQGVPFPSLSDRHMVACQLALPPGQRRHERIAYLQALLGDSDA